MADNQSVRLSKPQLPTSSGMRVTLVNATNITPRTFINDAAGSEAGCTTGPLRTPVLNEGQGLAVGKFGRCAPEAERNSQCCA